ncbi:predicted protein [Coccidioides posadasii str. Silveira]|uniref:Predicted protein n=1 Tax=Coccidioides posadasii (strain RMSCC 757 / Silveira) TaxID=443226 RepID=E9CWS5_COCPS|nr:predicted protein [Coccidioides posadasii str. Silveira]
MKDLEHPFLANGGHGWVRWQVCTVPTKPNYLQSCSNARTVRWLYGAFSQQVFASVTRLVQGQKKIVDQLCLF